ncbi:MAG: hypothetical protein D6677_13720 [Calditrichaeota bacterium]|nr:MAG: hypothetical protein D6677_13720 [Calditrichota bacterium]
MEFLLVPLFFGAAVTLLGLGKLLGGRELGSSCSSGVHLKEHGHDDATCGACSNEDVKFYVSREDPGFDRVAQLGYPNREKRFIDKLDFKPERFK